MFSRVSKELTCQESTGNIVCLIQIFLINNNTGSILLHSYGSTYINTGVKLKTNYFEFRFLPHWLYKWRRIHIVNSFLLCEILCMLIYRTYIGYTSKTKLQLLLDVKVGLPQRNIIDFLRTGSFEITSITRALAACIAFKVINHIKHGIRSKSFCGQH